MLAHSPLGTVYNWFLPFDIVVSNTWRDRALCPLFLLLCIWQQIMSGNQANTKHYLWAPPNRFKNYCSYIFIFFDGGGSIKICKTTAWHSSWLPRKHKIISYTHRSPKVYTSFGIIHQNAITSKNGSEATKNGSFLGRLSTRRSN